MKGAPFTCFTLFGGVGGDMRGKIGGNVSLSETQFISLINCVNIILLLCYILLKKQHFWK